MNILEQYKNLELLKIINENYNHLLETINNYNNLDNKEE